MSILMILKLLGSLALLMYGMKVMSEGLQKMAGPQLRHVLGAMTTNRVTGLLTGAFVTAAVQSSTATTVMTVSFVNAGLLSLAQAISVIMGANIGTTLTAWIMGAANNFNMGDMVYPTFVLGIILIYSKTSGRKNAGEFVFGLCFLLLGLATLKSNAVDMHLDQNEDIIHFFESTGQWGFWSTLLFLFLGGIMTMAVQSSAAVMAITMMLCSQGVLPIYQGIALVLGENIGTTITSNVAAMTGNSQARSAALAHLVFNLFGVLWVLLIFHHFVNLVCGMVGYDAELAAVNQTYAIENKELLNLVLPAFHTAFNVCNVLILIWCIKPIEMLVKRVFTNKGDEDEDFRLKFITGGLLSTAELSIMEARKELNHYAERTQRMFGLVQQLLHTKGIKDFAKLYARIEKYEGISDNMELEIANYLNNVSDGRLSSETKLKIRAMLREVSEIESIGDSCYKIAVSLNHKRQNQPKEDFTIDQYRHIEQIMKMADESLNCMSQVLKANTETNVMASFNKENELNAFRDRLKNLNLEDIDNGLYTYQTGIYYMDIVNECEKLGDYVINVVEARSDRKEKKQ